MKLNVRSLFGVVVLACGLFLTGILLKSLIHDVPIWVFGEEREAAIVEAWVDNPLPRQVAFQYYFRYEFSTPDGETFTGSSRVTEMEYLSYRIGGHVKIKYLPSNPAINRIDDSRFVPFLICTYIPFLLICAFALVAGKEIIDS